MSVRGNQSDTGDLVVAFCQEVIRQQALLRIIAAAIRSDMANQLNR